MPTIDEKSPRSFAIVDGKISYAEFFAVSLHDLFFAVTLAKLSFARTSPGNNHHNI
jgi:hypothetical protein